MNAELVLDRMGAGVIALTERAVGVEQKLGYQKERNALCSRRRVGEPRQNHMNDVVGEIVLAIGDEDLLSGDAVTAVRRALGLGAQRAEVRAGLRLGELHGAHPFARNQLRQIGALEFVAAVRRQRINRRHGENRAETEGHGRRIPHFDAGGVERMRQVLAAPLRGRGERVPARLRPGAVGLLPSRCGGDHAILEPRAIAIADCIEGAENIVGELARFREHRLDDVIGKLAIKSFGQGRAETRRVLERKDDIGDRRLVGHRLLSG